MDETERPSRSRGPTRRQAILGCLLGTAVGDALGLPYEGLSRKRARRILGSPTRYRFVFGRGMVSDDTEHTILVAQALILSDGAPERFAKLFGWYLRFWLAGLPAGMGFATLRSILKLWLGFSPKRSGVYSAGNGPAMRAAILGIASRDASHRRCLVEASSRITHTDPKALWGALAVALAADLGASGAMVDGAEFLGALRVELEACSISDTDSPAAAEFLALVGAAVASVEAGGSTEDFAGAQGLERGVTGYVNHTVPVCLHAWLSHPSDFVAAVQSVIRCGGDADTTAAIVGGIAGASCGIDGIPDPWLGGLWEWPWSVRRICALGESLAERLESNPETPDLRTRLLPWWSWWLRLPRNLFFLALVLLHGFRRLFPPY